jgi:hypothetical protein
MHYKQFPETHPTSSVHFILLGMTTAHHSLELLRKIPKVIVAIPSEQSFTKAKQLLPHATKQVVVSPLDAKQFSGR